MKKLLSGVISAVIILSSFGTFGAFAENETAAPTASTVLVDDSNIELDAYLINDNNYFKLRDLAYVLNSTEKKFSVGYDNSLNTISLTSGQTYEPVGGELETGTAVTAKAYPTSSKIVKDGKVIELQAYLINDNNYFKLRDIGELFNFNIGWDGATNTVSVNTKAKYESEDNMDDTYYKDYKDGDSITLKGTIKKLGEFKGDSEQWGEDSIIMAAFVDNSGNEWLIPVHLQEDYGFGHIEDYKPYIGKKVEITGTYEGVSKLYNLPCVLAYDIKDADTGSVAMGYLRAKELADKGETINPDEPFVVREDYPKSMLEKCLTAIKLFLIENDFEESTLTWLYE